VTAVSTNGVASVANGSPNPTVVIDPLGAPVPAGPTGTSTTDMPSFTWAAALGPNLTSPGSYTLKVTDKATGQVLNVSKLTGISYALTAAQALTPGHSYSWSVTAVSTNGQATIASIIQSLAVAPLTAPVLTSVNSGTFSWQPVPDADHYAFQIKDSTTGVVVLNVPAVLGTSYTLSAAQAGVLKSGHSYTWLVAAVSTNGKVVVWSGGLKFTAPA
jgi:hypothetical protein